MASQRSSPQGHVEDPLARVIFVGVPAGTCQGPARPWRQNVGGMAVEAPVSSLMIEAQG
jgi:hypothetical protein